MASTRLIKLALTQSMWVKSDCGCRWKEITKQQLAFAPPPILKISYIISSIFHVQNASTHTHKVTMKQKNSHQEVKRFWCFAGAPVQNLHAGFHLHVSVPPRTSLIHDRCIFTIPEPINHPGLSGLFAPQCRHLHCSRCSQSGVEKEECWTEPNQTEPNQTRPGHSQKEKVHNAPLVCQSPWQRGLIFFPQWESVPPGSSCRGRWQKTEWAAMWWSKCGTTTGGNGLGVKGEGKHWHDPPECCGSTARLTHTHTCTRLCESVCRKRKNGDWVKLDWFIHLATH